jgi:hypothetical protein
MSRRTREDTEDKYIRRHRHLLLGGAPAFDPTSLGVVGAWFDVASATNAGPGLAFTLPNLLSANHATTTTDARKPTISAASNGVPILVCSASCLQVALHAAVNSATTWWIHFHMRLTSATGNPIPFGIDNAGSGGASARKLLAQRFGGDLGYCFANNTTGRSVGPASLWPLNTWVGCGLEINLPLESSPGVPAADTDRMLWTSDGLPVVSAAAAIGGLGALPLVMPTPTGFMNLFAQAAVAGSNGIVGEIGRYILVGNGAMSGVTSGCLTPAARLSLSAFGRPA